MCIVLCKNSLPPMQVPPSCWNGLLASGTASTVYAKWNAGTGNIGPSSRYCFTRNPKRSPPLLKAFPASGIPPPSARGGRVPRPAWPECRPRDPRLHGSSADVPISRIARDTTRPIGSRLEIHWSFSTTSAYSVRGTILSKRPQACTSEISIESRGVGVSSQYSAPMTTAAELRLGYPPSEATACQCTA